MPDSDVQDYHSFILRCWRGEGRRLRLRLVDVRRGTDRPVGDLADLPALLEHLVGSIPDSPPDFEPSPNPQERPRDP